jgi:hypothetical protein
VEVVHFTETLLMTVREMKIRAAVTFGYFIICFTGLFYYTFEDTFCSRPREAGHAAQTLNLTIACTLWEAFVSMCGWLIANRTGIRGLAALVSTVLALAGFVSVPFWIYDSGRFLLQGTSADVSCFFTEGYGMAFPLFVAPALALATLAGELVMLKTSDPRDSAFTSIQLR